MDFSTYPLLYSVSTEFCTLPDYAPPSIGRLRVRCGGGVRISGGVGIRQSGSDFNEGMHNLAGALVAHRVPCLIIFGRKA